MKYKYLLFDLDGTLIDTTEGVLKSAQHSLRFFGIEKSLSELKPFMGPPLSYSYTVLCGLNDSQTALAIKKYRERYKTECNKESKVFPEIPSLLNNLKNAGYVLGVATSKLESSAVNMLEYFNLAKYFEFITGSDLNGIISSKSEVIEEALKRFGITSSKHSALMIGDMKYDDIGAAKVGIDCFGIYTGTAKQNEHEENGATYIAYSFKELEEKLLGEFYLSD